MCCLVFPPEIVMHDAYITDVQRITLNESCMTISGGRTKQLDIFCHVTRFSSDFLSFIVVELIRFFHGALQYSYIITLLFPSAFWHCWLDHRKGIRPVKSWVLVCCSWWQFDWSFARLVAPVVTTTSIILSCIKPANPGSPGKSPVRAPGL